MKEDWNAWSVEKAKEMSEHFFPPALDYREWERTAELTQVTFRSLYRITAHTVAYEGGKT